MNWIDIACIVYACVTANHLGLISAIERAIKVKLWVIDCPKCLTFWLTLTYQLITGRHQLAQVLAISFLSSYAAIWLELAEGYIDTLYLKLYEKINAEYPDDKVAADADASNTAGTMSDV